MAHGDAASDRRYDTSGRLAWLDARRGTALVGADSGRNHLRSGTRLALKWCRRRAKSDAGREGCVALARGGTPTACVRNKR